MLSFRNPVEGVIHPNSFDPPTSNHEFRVSNNGSFAQHRAAGRGLGIDIGNRDCGAKVLAMADGEVVRCDTQDTNNATALGEGALIVNIDHPDHAHVQSQTGYAHMVDFAPELKVGDRVTAGQLIGHVGRTGFGITECHLHFHVKQLVGGTLVHQDPWPLLAQNQEDEVTTITVTRFESARRWEVTTGGNYSGFKVGSAPRVVTLDPPTGASADGTVEVVPLPAGWPAGPLLRVIDGAFKGFFIEAARVSLQEAAPTAVTMTRDPCQAAVQAAVAQVTTQFEERISRIKQKAATFGADVSDD